MKNNQYQKLLEVMECQRRECLREAEHPQTPDTTVNTRDFQTGAAMALQRAIDYCKDAQAGIL